MPDEQTSGSVIRAEFDEGQYIEGDYFRWLRSIEPESLRRAWLDGDMRALSGMYFRDFRPNGPLHGEPVNANHVYKPDRVQLEPWFHAWGSLDWGYIHPSAFYLHRKAPWGQIYTEKEIVVNRTEPFELGVLLARELTPVLDKLESKHINIFLSPDAYAKRESENTVASQLAAGIASVYGPGSAFVAELSEKEREMRSEEALLSMKQRRAEQKRTMISLVRANTDRVAGWMHMQTLMRFRPLSKISVPDKEFANRLYEERGLVAYKAYMDSPEFAASQEPLPKWQISAECRELIRCIQQAMHKPGTNDVQKWDATESQPGDDPIDASRMGLFSEERQGEAMAPLDIRVAERVDRLEQQMPGMSDHTRIMARVHAEYRETAKKSSAPVVGGYNRLAVRRHALANRVRERAGV